MNENRTDFIAGIADVLGLGWDAAETWWLAQDLGLSGRSVLEGGGHCVGVEWARAVARPAEVTPEGVALWLRSRLTPGQVADVVAHRVLVGDVVTLPEGWSDDVVIAGVEVLGGGL